MVFPGPEKSDTDDEFKGSGSGSDLDSSQFEEDPLIDEDGEEDSSTCRTTLGKCDECDHYGAATLEDCDDDGDFTKSKSLQIEDNLLVPDNTWNNEWDNPWVRFVNMHRNEIAEFDSEGEKVVEKSDGDKSPSPSKKRHAANSEEDMDGEEDLDPDDLDYADRDIEDLQYVDLRYEDLGYEDLDNENVLHYEEDLDYVGEFDCAEELSNYEQDLDYEGDFNYGEDLHYQHDLDYEDSSGGNGDASPTFTTVPDRQLDACGNIISSKVLPSVSRQPSPEDESDAPPTFADVLEQQLDACGKMIKSDILPVQNEQPSLDDTSDREREEKWAVRVEQRRRHCQKRRKLVAVKKKR